MADVGASVHTHLQTDADVTTLTGTRGYPGILPQEPTLPAYVYNVISTQEAHHLTGISGVSVSRVQVDSYATTWSGAHALGDEIRLALLSSRPITAAGVTFDKVRRDDSDASFEPPVDGSDIARYRVRQDFLITHSETTS